MVKTIVPEKGVTLNIPKKMVKAIFRFGKVYNFLDFSPLSKPGQEKMSPHPCGSFFARIPILKKQTAFACATFFGLIFRKTLHTLHNCSFCCTSFCSFLGSIQWTNFRKYSNSAFFDGECNISVTGLSQPDLKLEHNLMA